MASPPRSHDVRLEGSVFPGVMREHDPITYDAAWPRGRRLRPRPAFTLVEVLIVISVLAVLAGVVVPQVTSVLDEVKQSTMLRDLRELTMAIERYRLDHEGLTPDLIENETLIQLVSKTDVEGNVGTGPEHIYGPYLPRIGPNPLNGVSRVFRVSTAPPDNLSNRIGWVYHPASGQIWAGLYGELVDLNALQTSEATGQ